MFMLTKPPTDSLATSESIGRCNVPQRGGFRQKFRQMFGHGLHRLGLLHAAKQLARSYEFCSVAGSRLPRLRKSAGSKFGILCYHRVGTEGVPLFSRLEPKVFEAQMRYVTKHYRVVPLGQLCRELQDGAAVEPTLAVTFDDGYRDLYTHAFPVLQKYQIPATIYLIGRCMETGEVPWYDKIFLALKAVAGESFEIELERPRKFKIFSFSVQAAAAWEIVSYLRKIPDTHRQKWCAAFEQQIPLPLEELEGRMLDWSQVRTMHRAGVFFGSHTMSHPVVSQLGPQALEEELVASKQFFERGLGAPIDDFAYPFGKPEDGSLAATEFLTRSGYRSAVTTTEGFNTTGTDRFQLRRLQIGEDSSLANFAFSVSRLFLESPVDVCSFLRRSELLGHPEIEMRKL